MNDLDRSFRLTLLAAGVFNGIGALGFGWPAGAGALMGLPTAVPPVYLALVVVFVLQFGALYFWLARQPVIPRAMVGYSAIGKTGAFLVFLACGFAGALPWRSVALGGGDLVFAVLFLAWLRRTGPSPA